MQDQAAPEAKGSNVTSPKRSAAKQAHLSRPGARPSHSILDLEAPFHLHSLEPGHQRQTLKDPEEAIEIADTAELSRECVR